MAVLLTRRMIVFATERFNPVEPTEEDEDPDIDVGCKSFDNLCPLLKGRLPINVDIINFVKVKNLKMHENLNNRA